MKYILPFVILVFFMIGCDDGKNTSESLGLPEWVIYESHEETGFESYRWGTNEPISLFMMSPHPAGLSRSMVNKMASDTADRLELELEKIEGVVSLKREETDIFAGEFSGKEIIFILATSDAKNVYQCIYVLWDGNRLWQGQLTGYRKEDLAMVRTILESRKTKRSPKISY